MNVKDKITFALNNHDDYAKFSCWIYLWQKILIDWNLNYFKISEFNNYCKNTKSPQISFSNSNFFNSGEFAWPYSLENAKLVIEKAKFHTNVYNLLLNHPFKEELSLHKTFESLSKINPDYDEDFFLEFDISNSIFANSKKTQEDYFNSLGIADWTLTEVIVSAICYCIQQIHIENSQLPKTIFWEKSKSPKEMQKKSLSGNLRIFFDRIFHYLLYFETHEILVKVFIQTNIISVYKLELIKTLKDAFKEIDKKELISQDLYIKRNGIHGLALFRIFQAFNVGVIFPDKLILTVVEWNTTRNYFGEIRNLLEVCELFLNKLTLFMSNVNNTNLEQKKSEDNIEKINKSFVIAFFQLQTMHEGGIQYGYGDLDNPPFTELVEYFHRTFPSFSVEELLSITAMQYYSLKKKKKTNI